MKSRKNLLSLFWFWLTTDIRFVKAAILVFTIPVLAWAPLVYMDKKYPWRYDMADLSRWEIWVALLGVVVGWSFVAWLASRDKRRKRKQLEAEALKGNF